MNLKTALIPALITVVAATTGCQSTSSTWAHDVKKEPRAGYMGNNPHYSKRMPVISFDSEVLLVRDDYDSGFSKVQPPAPPAEDPLSTYTLQSDLLFDFDKSTLKPEASKIIDELVDLVVQHYQVINIVTVSGHTDRFGTESYNTNLARKRAETVAQELVNRGFIPNDIAIRSYGESSPVTDGCFSMSREDAKKCLAPDRRVEIQIDGLVRNVSVDE